MKAFAAIFVILLAGASAARAAGPAPSTSLHAVRALSNAEAAQKLPVAFQATVTYYRSYEHNLFVQDGADAIFVYSQDALKIAAGDRVLIEGTTLPSFRPIIVSSKITRLGQGTMPLPLPSRIEELTTGDHDCQVVSVRGVVESADVISHLGLHSGRLGVLIDGLIVWVNVDTEDESALSNLLDAEVEVNGVASGIFDGKNQQTGVRLHSSSLAQIRLVKRAPAAPWSLPLIPMDEVLPHFRVVDRSERVRVHGSVTYYEPGSAVVIQEGTKSLWVETSSIIPVKVGDVIDVTGFPETQNGFLQLTRGEIQSQHISAPVTPLLATRSQLAASRNIFDLVSVEGQVTSEARGATQDEYNLMADGQLFTAIYRNRSAGGADLRPIDLIPIGARVRVTGICIAVDADANAYGGQVPFNILLRSLDDVAVVEAPSILNIRNLLLLVGLLVTVVFIFGVKSWLLGRKVRQQALAMAARTAAEADLERRRSCILEDINGVRPLTEILVKITEMASSALHGAPSWCEHGGWEVLGSCPADPGDLRVVAVPIDGRNGVPEGRLFAGLDRSLPPDEPENMVLANGAKLAALAIETRRLYQELRRRSEFDLLTEIPNRFAFEKFLDARIEEARNGGKRLGLIYIDLDNFKPVNDTYGHSAGDAFLQSVARRMSDQLLGGDLMARLGGDEFAAVVSLMNGRPDLAPIIGRLQRCFEEPFLVEGHRLNGGASLGVAVYPEDGTTRDALLTAADSSMYMAKKAKRFDPVIA
ncbi:MAG: GGDEF domain-containing protein [Terracidiphilus sp.]|jgi:diguanylate cyclase (GGDEF)-like protein